MFCTANSVPGTEEPSLPLLQDSVTECPVLPILVSTLLNFHNCLEVKTTKMYRSSNQHWNNQIFVSLGTSRSTIRDRISREGQNSTRYPSSMTPKNGILNSRQSSTYIAKQNEDMYKWSSHWNYLLSASNQWCHSSKHCIVFFFLDCSWWEYELVVSYLYILDKLLNKPNTVCVLYVWVKMDFYS